MFNASDWFFNILTASILLEIAKNFFCLKMDDLVTSCVQQKNHQQEKDQFTTKDQQQEALMKKEGEKSDGSTKPPISYVCLIAMALKSTKDRK